MHASQDIDRIHKNNNRVSFTGLNLSIDGTTGTTAEANNLTAATAGTVTTTVSDGDLDTLTGLNAKANAALSVTVTDTAGTAAELNTVNAGTTSAINANAVVTIESSTASDLATLMTAAQDTDQFTNTSFVDLTTNGVTITGGTTIDVTDLNNAISGTNTVATGAVDLIFSADNATTTINGGTATELSLIHI